MDNRFISDVGCLNLTHVKKDEILTSFNEVKENMQSIFIQVEGIKVPTWQNTIIPYHNAQSMLHHFYARLNGIYIYSIGNESYQGCQSEIYLEVSKLNELFELSSKFIENVKKIKKSSISSSFSDVQKNFIRTILIKADKLGVFLDQETKNEIEKLNEEISNLCQKYNENIQKETCNSGIIISKVEDLGDLPQSWKEIASKQYTQKTQKDSSPNYGPWYISLNSGVLGPFRRYSKNRELKKEISIIDNSLVSKGKYDNTEIINNLLLKRKKKAVLLGEQNYLDYSLKTTTAKKDYIDKLIQSFQKPMRNLCHKEYSIYENMAQNDGITDLKPWDIAYFSRKFRENKGIDIEEIKSFFPFNKVVKNCFLLFEECFEIEISDKTNKVQVWNDDVSYYEVKSQDEVIGGFFLDPYQRPGEKLAGTQNVGALQVVIRNASWNNGNFVEPISLLSYGFQPPTNFNPCLLSHDQIVDFFHEFGHYLSVIFRQKSSDEIIPDIGIYDDADEFESVVFESWARNTYILGFISEHYETGEKISYNLLQQLKYTIDKGVMDRVQSLLYLSSLSLEIYSDFDPTTSSIYSLDESITKRIYPPPYYDDNRSMAQCMPLFSLGGYISYCYMYLWSMTISYTYLEEIEKIGWNKTSVKNLGKKLKETLYSSAAIGEPFKALRKATGFDLPNIEEFAKSLDHLKNLFD